MARISEGRAANSIAPEFSGGGNAEAGPDVSADAGSGGAGADAGSGGGEARAGSAVPVTATPPLSKLLGGVPGACPDIRMPESHDLRHPDVKTLRQFARDLVPDR
jgi:hypothetical protein